MQTKYLKPAATRPEQFFCFNIILNVRNSFTLHSLNSFQCFDTASVGSRDNLSFNCPWLDPICEVSVWCSAGVDVAETAHDAQLSAHRRRQHVGASQVATVRLLGLPGVRTHLQFTRWSWNMCGKGYKLRMCRWSSKICQNLKPHEMKSLYRIISFFDYSMIIWC